LTTVFFSGVQLIILGTIGEYLGRLFLDHGGNPQFVVRYSRSKRGTSVADARFGDQRSPPLEP
jgi:hypothetical protein